MLSIQTLGLEILNHEPRSLYILGGSEYGIKCRYIEELATYYGNKVEAENMLQLIDMFSTRRLIPLSPTVYVVRYDKDFYSSLNKELAAKILNCNIIGTIICIYESDSQISKFNKLLPDNTAEIQPINSAYIQKYLMQEFPKLDQKLIDVCIQSSNDYGQARLMCNSLSYLEPKDLPENLLTISKLIGSNDVSTDKQVRLGVAGRDFNYLMSVLEIYNGDYNSILYTILQTMIELDKISDNKRVDSDIRDYQPRWTREDIYYMFNHTYEALQTLRSSSSYDIKNCLIYLFGLLGFARIPSLDQMKAR